jgi:glycosyltransferase involved in cell wall biosynthesis
MKVLIFSLAYIPFVGGAELAIKDLTDRIGGIEFDLITTNLDGKQKAIEKIGNVNVHRIGNGFFAKYFFPLMALKYAETLHQKNQYDAIWSLMANQAGLAAMKFKKRNPKVKYILTLQEGDSLKRIWSRTFFMRSSYKKIYTTADRIQAISNYLAKRAVKYGFKKPVDILPNGVDLNHFKKLSQPEILEMREKLGITDRDFVVISASRLVNKNGLDTLIKSVKNLDVKVILIGRGNQEIKLKSLAQELGVRDKILFLGHIEPQAVPKYLSIADIFVRPSRSEGLGSAFLEAMAMELPVIGTKVGGIPDFLKHEETGLFCEVGNPTDLANQIDLLINDKDLKDKIISNGKKLVEEQYNWDNLAKKMKVIIAE